MQCKRTRFPCATCAIVFTCREKATYHFLSDHHKYNYYRKFSARLPVVTSKEYEERVKEHQKDEELCQEPVTICCTLCKRKFSNMKSFETHMKMAMHQINLLNCIEPEVLNKKMDNATVSIIENIDYELDDDVKNSNNENNCLFCLYQSDNLQENLKHMDSNHSFSIPDEKHCVDVVGLLRYLTDKIENS